MSQIPSRLHWTSVGEGDPVLLIHGDLENGRAAWGALMRRDLPGYRLVAVDRRGNGASPTVRRTLTIAREAQDLLDVVDACGAVDAHLVGHSSGAVVALDALRQAPGRVRSLHLIEPPLLGIAGDDPCVSAFLQATQGLFGRRDLSAEAVARGFLSAVLGEEESRALASKPAWPAIVREARALRWREPPASYSPARGSPTDSVPIHVYLGGRSHPAFEIVATRLATIVRVARIVRVHDAGHDLQITETFARALWEGLSPSRR